LRNRRDAPLRITAARNQSAHPVAHAKARLRHGGGIAGLDNARHFQPRQI